MATIRSAVGIGAPNLKDDVVAVQALLKHATNFAGSLDGNCDTATTDAILEFQQSFLSNPDGTVEPDGVTWRSLVAAATMSAVIPEWSGNSSEWTQEKKLLSMEPVLRMKVPLILAALRAQGFMPKIVFGWRSVAVQEQLFREGKTTVHFSFHNAQKPDGTPNAYAADIIDSRWAWTPKAETNGFWRALGRAAKNHGLVWGGDWIDFKDVAHVQSRQNVQLAATKLESGL